MGSNTIIVKGKQAFTIEGIKKQALDVLLREGEHAPTLLAEGTEGTVLRFLPDMPEEPNAKKRYQVMQGVDVAAKKRSVNYENYFLSVKHGREPLYR
ncbi:MAG: hypothetical protein NVSMB44_32900 [Ktedonobacteraceae bacterium]